MEINAIKTSNLRNSEHFNFLNEVMAIINNRLPIPTEILALTSALNLAVQTETTTLNLVRKSEFSAQIEQAVGYRHTIFSGFVSVVAGNENHYTPTISAAAKRLRILLNTYGNVTVKPIDEETGDLKKLMIELTGKYAADVVTLNMNGWVTELNTANMAVDSLKNSRDNESKSKPSTEHKVSRTKSDEAYRALVKRINALIEVTAQAQFINLAADINQKVANYNRVLDQRKGINAKDEVLPPVSEN